MHSLRLILAFGLALSAGGALADGAAPARLPPSIRAAAAYPGRADERADDARRHGPELLAFAGVRRGDAVLELIPGAGYFTRLFSRAVGPRGHVYALWPDQYAKEAVANVADMRAMGRKSAWANVTTLVQPANAFSAPRPLDLVFTSQNYHDYPDRFMQPASLEQFNAQVFQALKPGGVYLVIDHATAPGRGLQDTESLHRIDEATVKTQVQAAGFVFEDALPLLRNPADDHTLAVFNPKIRGHTDQFILRFRKPK